MAPQGSPQERWTALAGPLASPSSRQGPGPRGRVRCHVGEPGRRTRDHMVRGKREKVSSLFPYTEDAIAAHRATGSDFASACAVTLLLHFVRQNLRKLLIPCKATSAAERS